ncbi:MAG: FixH family protein [Flavobacteriales bacterium Tduv]
MKKIFHFGIWIVALVLLIYMSFIIYIAFIRPNVASELVSERYYEEEIKYQEVIDEKKNANALTEKVKIRFVSDGIRVSFPVPFDARNTTGEWFLLRSSDKRRDIRQKLFLDERKGLLIPSKVLIEGVYEFKLRWLCNGKNYLIERTLVWKP